MPLFLQGMKGACSRSPEFVGVAVVNMHSVVALLAVKLVDWRGIARCLSGLFSNMFSILWHSLAGAVVKYVKRKFYVDTGSTDKSFGNFSPLPPKRKYRAVPMIRLEDNETVWSAKILCVKCCLQGHYLCWHWIRKGWWWHLYPCLRVHHVIQLSSSIFEVRRVARTKGTDWSWAEL